MTDTIEAPANFVTEQLLTGNVTFNIVSMCFIVASVAVAITLWAVYRFQTKDDAATTATRLQAEAVAAETRLQNGLKAESELRKADVEGIHEHLKTFGNEAKEERKLGREDIQRLQTKVETLNSTLSSVDSALSYIKGRLEPKS